MRLGAIDVGTNSCRLLVLDIDEEGYQEIKRGMMITRLGEGVDKTGRLAKEAVKRTFKAITLFLKEMDKLGVVKRVIIGTSALRDVCNSRLLLDKVKEAAGLDIKIISGEEEARLNFLGIGDTTSLIIDIGGGSTEFIWHQEQKVVFKSLDMGAVRMTERYLFQPHLPVADSSLRLIEKDVKKELNQHVIPFLKEPLNSVVGVGGTITTLGAIIQKLETYDPKKIEGSLLQYSGILNTLEALSRIDLEERKKVPGLQPGRADVIVAGTKILQVIMESLKIPNIIISEHDLLYGVLQDLYQKIKK